MLCLNNRILDALESMHELDPKNKQLTQRIENMKQQIGQLKENGPTGESTSFKMPSSDKQAIVMLKLVKRLRDTVRNEHNKGRLDTQTYVTENARLETMQIRINIENVIKRANDSIARGQPGTALQLLRKGIDALSTKSDPYSIQAKQKLEEMLGDLDKNAKTKAMQKCSKWQTKSVTTTWKHSSARRKSGNIPTSFSPYPIKGCVCSLFSIQISVLLMLWMTQI